MGRKRMPSPPPIYGSKRSQPQIGIAEFAGLEFAGLENDGLENNGLENDGLDVSKQQARLTEVNDGDGKLIAYVQRHWVTKRSIGPARLSVRDNRCRTNNILESIFYKYNSK